MQGAIIGDIVGSVYEWRNIKTKDFPFITENKHFTDDTIMTIAVGIAVMSSKENGWRDLPEKAVYWMQMGGRMYPEAGWGSSFRRWLLTDNPAPYGSWGNGAAMRVSSCGIVGKDEEEVKMLAHAVTGVSHDSEDGFKAAESIALAVHMARNGASMDGIRRRMEEYWCLEFTLDEIRDDYKFDVSCRYSVPQAIEAFLESTSYEDAVRNAVSIGGDSDTIAAIAGSIAAEYWGVPRAIREEAMALLDDRLRYFLGTFEEQYPPRII